MSTINLTPEAVKAVNELCDAGNIASHICQLGNAEEALQKAAYDDDSFSYMFRFAYELKQMREEFEKLQEILGYEPERE